jgi:protein TonB
MPSLKKPDYDLRRLYSRSLEISLIVSLVTIIAAFRFSPQLLDTGIIEKNLPELIKVEDIINTIQKPKIPPPPQVPQIISAQAEDLADDPILTDIDDVKPIDLPDKPPSRPIIDYSDEEFIPVPEELPSPIGGLEAIHSKVSYTEIARRVGIEGTVYIEAKINKNGEVVDAIVLKGLGGGLDEEALDAVKTTGFRPGKQRGKPVNVKLIIPVKFVLR